MKLHKTGLLYGQNNYTKQLTIKWAKRNTKHTQHSIYINTSELGLR
jgi:hypothetical protein